MALAELGCFFLFSTRWVFLWITFRLGRGFSLRFGLTSFLTDNWIEPKWRELLEGVYLSRAW